MGTNVVVDADGQRNLDRTRSAFDRVEAVCSRFRPTSEVAELNRDPRSAVPVTPMLAGILRWADRARDLTDGLVDAAIGARLFELGYDRTFVDVIDLPTFPTAGPRPGWELVESVLHRSPGVAIDLGGIAKGWAADHVVERGWALAVSAGGDIRSSQPDAVVEILDPWQVPVARLQLGRGGLATSSRTRRRWQAGGRTVHHLIDPRTGDPADSPVLSATALAATSVEAEIAAKAVLLLGADGLAWAESQDWVREALVVWEDGSAFATTGLEVAA